MADNKRKQQYFNKPLKSMKNIYRRFFYRWVIKKFTNIEDTILDIGAGTGVFYDVAVEEKRKVIGIDLDKRNVRDNIVLKDFRDVKEEYDVFWNCNLIEHVDQFELMEIVRKYCRRIVITITGIPRKSFWDMPDHIRPYTIKCVKRLYKSYGFECIFALRIYPTYGFIVVGKKACTGDVKR